MFGCAKQPGVVYRSLKDILGDGESEAATTAGAGGGERPVKCYICTSYGAWLPKGNFHKWMFSVRLRLTMDGGLPKRRIVQVRPLVPSGFRYESKVTLSCFGNWHTKVMEYFS